jgi:hypothetical protein
MSRVKCAVASSVLTTSGLIVELAASAQVSDSGYGLPMNTALAGALQAIQTCSGNGYNVTATVVDVAGARIFELLS